MNELTCINFYTSLLGKHLSFSFLPAALISTVLALWRGGDVLETFANDNDSLDRIVMRSQVYNKVIFFSHFKK